MKNILAIALLLCTCIAFQPRKNDTARFYVGTGNKGPGSAVTLCELNLKDGTVTVVDTFGKVSGPGYVSLSPDQKYLYTVNQDHTIAAFAVGKAGALTYLNKQPAQGMNPCHVSVHPNGKMAFLANYTSGDWAAYPINASGAVGAVTATYQFSGSGPDKSRQEKPHAHCVIPSPNGKYVYISDLGTDRLMNYTVDAATGKVAPTQPGLLFYPTRRGSTALRVSSIGQVPLLAQRNESNPYGLLGGCQRHGEGD